MSDRAVATANALAAGLMLGASLGLVAEGAQHGGWRTFVGVNVSDTADTGRRFFERYGATYLQVRDPRASLVAAVGSQVLPTTLIVDRNGDVVDGHLGALTAPEVRDLLQAEEP